MSEHNALYSFTNGDKNNVKNKSIDTPKIENACKRKCVTMLESTPKHLKNNYWALLADGKNCNNEVIQQFKKHVQDREVPTSSKTVTLITSPTTESKNNNNACNSNNNNNTNVEKTNSNQNKNKKTPPLYIFDVDPNSLIEFVKKGLNINDFKIREYNNSKIQLLTSSIDDYSKIRAYLLETKTKFFTFTPKNLKTKTFLLKGLTAKMNPDLILTELKKFENENLDFIKVSPFTTKRADANGHNLPIYMVQISGESKISELKTIKGLLYRCIHWEGLRKSEIAQCRNCQSFQHSASNCYLPRRCVKCKDNHEIGKCSLQEVPATEREKLFCVLCNSYGHPASYKGCPKYKELQQKLRAKKQQLSDKKTQNSPIIINDNISYANMLKNNFTPQNVNSNHTINNILEQLNNSVQALSNQIINLNKQLQLQSSRIDALYSMIES